jgi:hypothetical protein
MRYRDIAGMQVPVYTEEQDLLDRAEKAPLAKSQLDERERELIRQMISRGLMRYYRRNNETMYRTVSVNDIWRDRDG